jgi:hypothetical protein
LAVAGTARADDGRGRDSGKGVKGPQYEATVTTTSQGVFITIRARQSTPGRDSAQPKPGAPINPGSNRDVNSTSFFRRSWVDPFGGYYSEGIDGRVYGLVSPYQMRDAISPSDWERIGRERNPRSVPRLLLVDGVPQGIVFVPIDGGTIRWGTPTTPSSPPGGDGGSTDPAQVALDVYAHVPLPDIKLRASPDLGLVAVPGWFWVEGYDGSSFGASRTVQLPPEIGPEVPFTEVPATDPRRQGSSFTVTVRVWPVGYSWSFGDSGGLETASLGQSYPATSDIQHSYEYSSLRHPEGFPVTMTAHFAAEYTVNGGAPQGLPGMQRTYALSYRVRELQGILVGR